MKPSKRSPKKLLKEIDQNLVRCSSLEETFGTEAISGLKQVFQQQRAEVASQIGRRVDGR